jgi:NAD(P)H-nitrite reductase large subunit
MRYVIVGNGVACIGAIEGIRKHDTDGEILVVSEEDKKSYGRPLISYYLGGKVKPEAMSLRDDAFYERNKVSERLGVRVTDVDPKAKTISLDDGSTESYDRLLLATGGKPIDPGLPGTEGPGVYSFTTWKSADEVAEAVLKRRRIAVIGAGLIALKAAEGLIMHGGVDVTLIVRSRIMRVYFDETAGEIVEKHLAQNGVRFQHATPEEILRGDDGDVRGVRTSAGEVPCDGVIMAVGVSPSTALAEAAGAKCDKGILVDDHMRTSVPDVYAAGDCAQGKDMLSDETAVMPIWPNASNQGANAGINMAGVDKAYPGTLSMNAIPFFGLATISIGVSTPGEGLGYEVHIDADTTEKTYRKLVFESAEGGDVLVGCILIGDVDKAGLYNSFITSKTVLPPEAREQIIKGEPSPLYWSEDYYSEKMLTGGE